MGSFSIWHWLIVLAIVVLIFGTKRLKNLGGDLGSSIRAFKSSIKDGEAEGEEHAKELTGETRKTTASSPAREKSDV